MRNIITIIAILIIPVIVYNIINKNSDELSVMAKDSNLPTMMTFSSTMCLDCQKMKSIIKEIEPEYTGKINFISVNATEKNKEIKELVKSYNITLVPTMLFIDKNENEVKRIEGAITREELSNELTDLCNG